MKTIKLTKRGYIRLISIAVAVLLALLLMCIVETVKKNALMTELSVINQRSVANLASYIDTLENDLRKMKYVSSPHMASTLSLSLARASTGAKMCLSQLESGGVRLMAVNKFLSQSGDYVNALNKKAANGERLTSEDRAQLESLHSYAKSLSEKMSFMEEVMLCDEIDFIDAVSTLQKKAAEAQPMKYSDSISDAENSFEDYPTLIYDGPFSDSILNKESQMLKEEEEISIAKAKSLAAKYMSINEKELNDGQELSGRISAYTFYTGSETIAITKNGGYLLYLLSGEYAKTARISTKEAIAKGREYLAKIGYTSLKDSYFFEADGICTINFAYTVDDVICYADLIKVGVALDTGRIVSVDASGYLMNHRMRDIPMANLSPDGAKGNISELLTVKKVSRAFIPTEDGKEVYAYEYLCSDKDNNDVLIYINAFSGREADVKLLLYADNGILTR